MQDELRLRARMIGTGVWLSVVLIAIVAAWIVVTWDRPHRLAMAAMVACAALVTGIVAMLPWGRIVASRWREPFFLSWSLSLIVFIATVADLDAGVRSPIVLMLFLTLVYAALSYPRWAVAVVSMASLLSVAAVSWLHAGASSSPTDPVYLAGLMVTLAVTGAMCMVQARLQHQVRAELSRVSRADPLTGALNRLGFHERIDAELRRAAAGGRPVALVLLDFDGFKEINDRHGHAAGDELLCWAVTAMASALRPGDALARLGGDEFAVLLPGTDHDEATAIADRLTFALSLRIGASAGVAAGPRDGALAEDLHHRADQRLYAAKRGAAGEPPVSTAAG